MKKITLIIFIFIEIYSINANSCEELDHPNETMCFEHQDNSKYKDFCCYFEDLNDDRNTFCKTVPYSSFYTGYNKEYINGKLFNVKCSFNEKDKTYALEPCGNVHKKGDASLKKCQEYSTFVDSCCFFSGKFDGNVNQGEQKLEKGCYWLGSKYKGKIQWAGAELECHHKYLNYSLLYFFAFIFLMISFF